ncbi:PREDICTED: death-associated protein kinase 1-like [Branchiostoma belcheri]|uniref:Death-associated protein kinase 1-like n=1 Tax=Branchiostoma belcheri TaxID=7741 RepID=A0A6P4XUI5_BRABE|nr:PREDICTED: death-associated protein kinase 1-like [Branchiostoma belcheri]
METVKRELQAQEGVKVRVKSSREWDFVDDQTPLHVASRHGQTAVAELLVQHGANLEARDGLLQQTPLHIATKQGHTATSEVLIRFGADIMAQDKLQQTPLHVAANWDYTGTSELLIYSGADLMAGDKLQQTPLHLAAHKGHAKTSQLLIRCGANVNAKDKYQRTSLHLAAAEGHLGICGLLIQSGANVMARDVEQKTPLHLAAVRGRTEIAELLLQSGADIMAKDEEQQTPLHRAARWGHSGTSELLIRNKADVIAKDEKQNTPLHLAAYQGHSETCRLLIHSEANVMAKNWERETPLHLAATRGHTEICIHLIRSGADVMVKNKDGKTPLDFSPDQETWHYWKSLYKQARKDVQDKIYRELLQKSGGVKVNRCKVFLCGKERTGKSTLRNALTQGLFAGFPELLTETDHHEPTPGVDIGTFNVPGVGEVSMWDFAGQSEYGVTHSMLMDAENTIFIVMYDITDDIETQQEQVRYWLKFIKSCRSTGQPDVILVASHGDKVELSTGEGQAFNILELMKAEFKDHLHISDDVLLMDCRKSRTPQMDHLKSLLVRIKSDLLEHQHEIPKLCGEITKRLPIWCKSKTSPKFPVMMWPDYLEAVKEIDPLVNEDFLEKSTGFLHSLGEVLFICPGTCDPIIILKPNWLSQDILGTMMAPENFPIALQRTSEGCITKAEMLRVFQDAADVDLLITLLKEVLLCHSYDGQTFIVPGLLTQTMPPEKWQPTNEPNVIYFGKQVQCACSTDMFSPGFFPRVQTCFMREMVKRPLMWRDGIKCEDTNVEGLIKLSEDGRCLNICVRSAEGDRKQCSKMLQHLENIIVHMLDEYSPGTGTVEKVLSARALKEHREDFYSYGKVDISKGTARGGTVIHPILGFTEQVNDLLCGEVKVDPLIMHRVKLVDCLRHIHSIVDHLLTHNILNLDESDVIRAERTPQGRARMLLDIIIAKGAQEVFMSILRKVHPQAADILE